MVWIVEKISKFNSEGIVPVNRTQKEVNHSKKENAWVTLPMIQALTAIAALLHDWGKASKLFQDKLKHGTRAGDPIRHEWISCLLLKGLVSFKESPSDDYWLASLASGNLNEDGLIKAISNRNENPLQGLPPVAKLVAWLIVSHHKLPLTKEDWRDENAPDIDTVLNSITKDWGYENRYDEMDYHKRIDHCFQFPSGLMSNSPRWLNQIKKWGQHLKHQQDQIEMVINDGSYRLILHHARLCLMLGDNLYSSQDSDTKWEEDIGLFANTDRETKQLKQKLDEHLFGVAKSALQTTDLLPELENGLPKVHNIKVFKKSNSKEFAWQDNAVEKIRIWQSKIPELKHGSFTINMASTGCGKTFANAKIMQAFSEDGKSLRYILALGLRTLTLQTGDEYRQRVGLDDSELAVLIGSQAVKELHSQDRDTNIKMFDIDTGSESSQPLLDEHIDFKSDISEEGLTTVLKIEKDRKLLYAPVLVCTIDHLMAATETKRGNRYILPSLRLMSSDLVIDEIDDFTGSDLIAIGRLIHLTGMLGRKVMLSSATIPPDLAEGYLNAYNKGWQIFCQTRNASRDIVCTWVDEFNSTIHLISNSSSKSMIHSFQQYHEKFIEKRVELLNKQPGRRKGEIIECKNSKENVDFGADKTQKKQEQYFSIIKQAALEKHQKHHTTDQKTGIAVSFGVIRMSNISPCIDLTKYLLQHESKADYDIKTMVYHSQQVLLLRHQQEKYLDLVLKRREKPQEQPEAFNNEIIRNHLKNCNNKNLIFILVASPVEEVGRDHDFDWAVVEPSSYRSIIQISGRVRRHRAGEVTKPNIAIMQYNWRSFRTGDQVHQRYFNRPGYEEKITLESHDLKKLINCDSISKRLDAIPRIQKKTKLDYNRSLVDLEHFVTQSELTNYHRGGPETLQGFLEGNWFLTALPQQLNPFRKSENSTNLFYVFNPEKNTFYFAEKNEIGLPINRETILGISQNKTEDLEKNNLWIQKDYHSALNKIVAKNKINTMEASLRYGELNLVMRDKVEYKYCDQFGLVKV